MESHSNAFKAYLAPFGAFMLLSMLGELVAFGFKGSNSLLVTSPQYWVFPLQAIVCGAVIAKFWRHYAFKIPRNIGFTLGVSVFVLLLWVSPQAFLHFPPRLAGFDPTIFASNPPLYGLTIGLRFLRLAIVVPLMEEIFWRGFLLRDLIDSGDFTRVPFGSYTLKSCLLVAVIFALFHWGREVYPGQDLVPALITGVLYNWVAYRTKSLASCVLAHSATNLILGGYIMQTKQWGFW